MTITTNGVSHSVFGERLHFDLVLEQLRPMQRAARPPLLVEVLSGVDHSLLHA